MSRPSAPTICGGRLRGLRLLVPSGLSTRPMRAMVREALFSMLGARVAGATVLDLYAGSGALGLEALSRGAARVTFVESAPQALDALRRNVAASRLDEGQAEIAALDVASWQPVNRCYDIVLADPPWALPQPLPAVLQQPGLLAPDAVLAIETPVARIAPRRLAGLVLVRERQHGSARLAIYGRG